MSYPTASSSAHRSSSDASLIHHFPLPGVLPPGQMLTLHLTLGILSHLMVHEGVPVLLLQQCFTMNEVALLLPLLNACPLYCPYEVLLACYWHGVATEEGTQHARQQLHHAHTAGTWRATTHPLHSMLSRIRGKTRVMGLELTSIAGLGSLLTLAPSFEQARGDEAHHL